MPNETLDLLQMLLGLPTESEVRESVAKLAANQGLDDCFQREDMMFEETLLSAAADSCSPSIVTEILNAGANPNLPSATPPIVRAVAADRVDIVNLLLRAGASLPARLPDGLPLLHLALSGSPELVGLLVAHGADPNVSDTAGDRPLKVINKMSNSHLDFDSGELERVRDILIRAGGVE